jgi:hypothetical protein
MISSADSSRFVYTCLHLLGGSGPYSNAVSLIIMAQSSANGLLFDPLAIYPICVQGVISASWPDRLEGLQITVGGGAT